MRYRESLAPKTKSQLRDRIVTTLMRAPTRHFPEDYGLDFDGAYYSLERGVENLRKKFGDAKADQLLDMIRQAKVHHEANDKLGSRLLQDVEMMVADRQPYAYPKELYRWHVDASLPELSDADLLDRSGDEEE
ncbi:MULTISPECIES: hypothetical protein [unclassified Sphingomonas]|uniref:hypothetical protein n=1 Tax=unclassified Sphingomonas TaxID=196159 RepID=UPI000A5F22C7|nr:MULTISPECIES: hypothetical protein [unclassified Sphingomonas]